MTFASKNSNKIALFSAAFCLIMGLSACGTNDIPGETAENTTSVPASIETTFTAASTEDTAISSATTAISAAEGTTGVQVITPSAEGAPAETAASAPGTTAAPATQPPAPVTEAQPVTQATRAPADIPAWKTAYRDKLIAYRDTAECQYDSMWDIQDIDNDGIPELMISEGQYHAAGVTYYYFENGSVTPVLDESGQVLRFGSYGVTTVCPEEHLVSVDDAHMGYYTVVEQKYENHRFTRIMTLTSNAASAEVTNGSDPLTYKKDDAVISEAEFQAALDAHSAKHWISCGAQYSFSDLSPLE